MLFETLLNIDRLSLLLLDLWLGLTIEGAATKNLTTAVGEPFSYFSVQKINC